MCNGMDNLSLCYLKDIAYVLAKPLTHVINQLLQSGTFPTDLRKARVTPIYKSGAQNIFNSYRPIGVLPVISKVFRKCVHAQVTNHLESKNCCQKTNFYFANTYRLKLLQLIEYGVSGMAQEWLCDYLFSRSQQVLFQGKLSSAEPILCGVPQGSILRLLLFILHFNSAMKTLSQCKMLMYADDTVLSCQKISETMAQWLTSRGLIWKKQEHHFTTKVPHYSKNFQQKFD